MSVGGDVISTPQSVARTMVALLAGLPTDGGALVSTRSLAGGTEGLLCSFRPMMTWDPPVLNVDVPYRQLLHLNGRGLLLVPSYPSWVAPDVLRDPTLPPVLVHPIERDLTLSAGVRSPVRGSAVAVLIGRTRTSLLESLADGRTTSELARRVGVSLGSVSQHTAVPREARLIRTSRAGKAVVHTITPLGRHLLNADDRAPPADAPALDDRWSDVGSPARHSDTRLEVVICGLWPPVPRCSRGRRAPAAGTVRRSAGSRAGHAENDGHGAGE